MISWSYVTKSHTPVKFIRLNSHNKVHTVGHAQVISEIQAIVFDFDGTLVDSAEDLRVVLNRLLGDLGLRPIETAEIKGMIGDGTVSYGYHHRPPSELNADHLVDRFDEILSLVIKPMPNRSETGGDAELIGSIHPFLSGPERHA